jgi:hypothetical protein
MGSSTLRINQSALIFLAVLAILILVAMPAWSSSGGVGSQNIQASDCSAHNVISPATITMSSSKSTVAPSELITVIVTVSGGSSQDMGVGILSKTTGSTGTMPQENGWTIVSDPTGGKFNYVETPYSGTLTDTWTLNAPATAGSYKLYAKIFHGNAAYVKLYPTGITITVAAATVIPPTVAISTPTGGSTVSGTIAVTATITPDTGQTISRADLSVDGAIASSLTVSPYTWSLNTANYANGLHTITVTGYDGGGRTGTASITVTSSNMFNPPQVSITAPAAGTTLTGTTSITASATADTGQTIARTEFRLDGALLGSDATSPYSWSLNTVAYSNGQHVLNVTAYDSGGRSAGTQVTVTFSNTPAPPTVSITAPANLANVGGNLTITASVTPSGGKTIGSTTLYIDGTNMGSRTTAPYTWTVDTYQLRKGTHIINVTAMDSGGMTGSYQMTVTVNNDAPAVQLVSPTDGTLVNGSIAINVNATAATGPPTVTLKVDGMTMGALSAAPYQWMWNTNLLADGNHTLNIRALDAKGNATELNATIIVYNGVPTMTLLSPLDLTTVNGTIVVRTSSTSPVGIAWTSISLDGKLLTEGNSSQISQTLNTLAYANGPHMLNMTARDTQGRNASRSVPMTFTNSLAEIKMTMNEGTASGSVEIGLQTSGSERILNATLYVDGEVVSTLNGTALTWTLDTLAYPDGDHQVNISAQTEGGRKLETGAMITIRNSISSLATKLDMTGLDMMFAQVALLVLVLGLVMRKGMRQGKK